MTGKRANKTLNRVSELKVDAFGSKNAPPKGSKGHTATRRSKKGSEKVLGKGSGEGL